MSSRRRKTWALAPIAVAIAWAMAAAAQANPLLSGYGGPGQGDQAIIGSTLLNTPRGGGSSSSGGSAEATAAALTATPNGVAGSSTSSQTGHGRHAKGAVRTAAKTPAAGAATGGEGPSHGPTLLSAAATSNGSGGALGLSAGDLVYLLLALAALALAGVLTRQLARRPH
jgi:hypothetical protein